MFSKNGNGTYKVAVIAQAFDQKVNSNSAPAWSGTYLYTNPGKALDTPTNLRWENGFAKWDVPADTSEIGFYEVVFFSADNPYDGYSQELAPGQFAEVNSWYLMMLGNRIGFRVSAVSNDANTASDSALATCATNFVYDPEAIQLLPAPKNLQYNPKTGQLTWDAVENADEYEVDVWFTGEDGEEVLYDTYYVDGQAANVYFHPDVEGTYRFAVKAVTESVLWSESAYSDYTYKMLTSAEVKELVSDITSDITSPEKISEAVESVKEMDPRSLANAMTATSDQVGDSVVAQIKGLEDKLDVNSKVSVNDGVEDVFAENTVEVVGAALNADSGTVTLSIQEKSADMPQVSEELYVNTVSFSMHLEHEETVIEELDAPVWIKLPVPKGMNPSLLWILHYCDGSKTPEIIVPMMTEEQGQWYASFAVTSFSDFAMTNRRPQIFLNESDDMWTAKPDPYYVSKQGGLCIWAVYDEDGRMIGTGTGTGSMTIPCDGEPAFAKLFIVDSESHKPTCTETPCILEMRED